jgi:hypothetical protein
VYKICSGKGDEFFASVIYNDVIREINVSNIKFDAPPAFQLIGKERLKDCIRLMIDEHREEGGFYLLSQWYRVKWANMK